MRFVRHHLLGASRHCEERSYEAIQRDSKAAPDCFAAAKRQFILSAAAGGVEGLAMTSADVDRSEHGEASAR